ncbi:hypothetical protein FJY84_05030 [Candidatus Bathyarchaeota archaeon]|nr:hypothetical protein [Candidatus Bathyarchaeota archaeon]
MSKAINRISNIFLNIIKFSKEIIYDVFHDELIRRAFANNAFDGALTLLGILMGNIVLTEFNPVEVIKVGLSTCLAIGMSGGFGRYLSELAERKRSLKQMEYYLLTDLSDTSLEREGNRKIISMCIVDGVSPALAAGIPLIPFFLINSNLLTLNNAIIASFILVFIVLLSLGVFLGKLADENSLKYGVFVVAVGFLTSAIIFAASILFQ